MKMSHWKFALSTFHIPDLSILTCENKIMSFIGFFFTYTLKINYGT